MTITTRAGKGSELTHNELDGNFVDLDTRTGPGWKDLTCSISASPGGAATPVLTNFQSAGTLQRKEYAFAVNDYVWLTPFHVNHDIKADGTSKAYLHVHWATSGTSVATVKWEFHVQRALRTASPAVSAMVFGPPEVYAVEAAPSGTAWQHLVTEVSDIQALTLTSPDELILVSLRRVTNGGTDNVNTVFGLMVDMHYEAERDASPNKAAPFWG